MSNPHQEFLEYLDLKREMYRFDRLSCENSETRYLIKNKIWVLESVIEEFLKHFGDRVDAGKSAREAEEKARAQFPKVVTIRVPGVSENDEAG